MTPSFRNALFSFTVFCRYIILVEPESDFSLNLILECSVNICYPQFWLKWTKIVVIVHPVCNVSSTCSVFFTVKNVFSRSCKEQPNHIFHIQCTFLIRLTVFDIIKQKSMNIPRQLYNFWTCMCSSEQTKIAVVCYCLYIIKWNFLYTYTQSNPVITTVVCVTLLW